MSIPTSVARSGTAMHVADRSTFHIRLRTFLIILTIVAALVCTGSTLLIKFWPFSEKAVIQDLAEASDSRVTALKYHSTYFPIPGCVLEGVQFRHQPQDRELVNIGRLRIQGSYSGILTGHVPRIIAEGARIFIPPFGTKELFHSQHSNLVVDTVVANGSSVEFAPSESHKEPLRFDIHEATLTNVRWNGPIGYRLKFHNPNPPGELAVNGKFGPWADGHPQDTPMSGTYSFEQADLSVYGGIAGSLSSQGTFAGAFQHISVSGTTDTPDFVVKESGHKVHLKTKFDAYVDATRGDTFLNRVEAEFGHTLLVAQGGIAETEGKKGKQTKLHITSTNGRIEDILGLFTREHSPMSGNASLETLAELPAGNVPFLKKVHLNGSFDIKDGSFTKWATQNDVDKLSAGARGQNKDDASAVVSDLRGRVDLTNGTAHFASLDFQVPGANARMHGVYNLENHRVDLHGDMRVDTKISKTSSGMKSFLLKILDPIFKKKKKGEIVPIHITGTYEKPEYGLDLNQGGQKAGKQKKP
ncbi:MAG TPA: AsmA-like C-terminal region-containing protein [Candidatus Sulfotelmatobacter sp.]|nr:AsmA-like C-terminal region-containing protein [Candidatus Sulfotelmatobacter sp.]